MKQKVFNTIKHYTKVWNRTIKGGISRSYLYKQEVFIRILRTILVIGAQIILLNVIFNGNSEYVGWTKPQAYLVLGIWNLVNYSSWSFFGVNLVYLENKILKGDFDYILLKPMSSWWLASFADFFIYNFVTAIAGIVLIAYYLIIEWSSITIINIIFGLIGILISILIWYFIYLFFASFTISNPRSGFLSITKELLGITKYPIDIFGKSLELIFYTIIPIAFVTTVPSNLIIGRISPIYIIYGLIIAIILGTISISTWNKNIKKYTSASS